MSEVSARELRIMEKHVTNDELLMLTQKAFERDEVADFLQGKNGYACPVNRFVPANVPTDFRHIIESGIYPYYNAEKSEIIVSKFKSAILELINGNAVQVWIAFFVTYIQIGEENKNKSPFNLIRRDLTETLKNVLIRKEIELRACKEWQGWNKENGLWQDIVRLNGILKKSYGVSVL